MTAVIYDVHSHILEGCYEQTKKSMLKYVVYGSNAPIFTMRSSMLIIDKAEIPDEETRYVRKKIYKYYR